MGTAALVRAIRRSIRERAPRRTLKRRLQVFTANLLKRTVSGSTLPALSVLVAIIVIAAGKMWDDGGRSILVLNALGSAMCVLLIANAKWVLDRDDFPRLDTLTVLPWTDRQWMIEFLKEWRSRWFAAPCFAAVTLVAAKLMLLPERHNGWLLVAVTFVAQVAIITALALCLANAAGVLARVSSLARLYYVAWIALLVATLAMVSTRFATAATAIAYPQILAILPTAWPAGVLHLFARGLSQGIALVLLGLCIAAALLTALIALWRLERSFKVAEVLQDPWGRGYVIRHSVWQYYRQWNEYDATVQGGQEFVGEDGQTAAAIDPPSDGRTAAEPSVLTGASVEGEAERWRDQALGRPLDDFWKRQGGFADWFSQNERDVLAFVLLAAGSCDTPSKFFRRGVRAMLLVAAVVVIGPLVIGLAARDRGEMLLVGGLVSIAYCVAFQDPEVSKGFRALPLSTSQWLWPRLKFQWVRLASVVPPGVLLLTAVLWNMGKPAAEISQWIAIVVTVAFLLPPLVLPIRYSEGCRDRWYSLASFLFLLTALGSLALLATGAVLTVTLPWPQSSGGLVLMAAATWFAWRTICAWHQRGPIDAPLGS